MENDILDSLDDLGYPGHLNVTSFDKIIKEGPKNCEFTKIVAWLSIELQVLCKLEGQVNEISSADDSSSFLLELSSFLKEMNCPYQCLLEGNVSQRLGTRENRLILLDFLTTEVEASRIINIDKPEKTMHVEMQETPTAKNMKIMITTLKLGKPPANITAAQLFGKLESKIKEIMNKVPPNKLSSPLFTGKLSDKQWYVLTNTQETMQKEYHLRRDMLLKRLDVTIQSFKWADRLKHKEKEIMEVFLPLRQLLSTEPNILLSDVLAAREDLSIIEKTSNTTVRKKTQLPSVHKVMIGRVPDRGGRPEEQQPPPPEMPSWQKRTDTPRDSNAGRGDRGGRIQGGGWSNTGGNNQQGFSSYGQGGNRNDPNQGGGYQTGGGYGSGYSQSGPGGYQGNYQGSYVQANQGGYQTGYMQTGQGMYQVAYQTPQSGYQQTGQVRYQPLGQGGYSQGGQGGDSRNARYNNDYRGDNKRQQYNGNTHSGRGGYSSKNEGYQYNNSGGGGGYNQENKDGWQNRGGGRGRGGSRGGRGGRGGRFDNQNQGFGATYGYSTQDQGYGQYQRY